MKRLYFLLLGVCLSSVEFEERDSDVNAGWLVVEDELTTSTERVVETETEDVVETETEGVVENSSDADADEEIVTTTTTEMRDVKELIDRIAEEDQVLQDDSHHDDLLYQAQIGFLIVLAAGLMYAHMNNE